MKRIIVPLILSLLFTALLAQNSGGSPPRDDRRPPAPSPGEVQVLTSEQQAQVKAILAEYDPDTLTAEQARAIHEAFRQAGLRAGPGMADTIRAAGFDPDRLRDLAPPPGPADGRNQPPPRPGDDRSQEERGRSESRKQTPPQQGQYSIDQAISDRAQLHTIAFDGLAFLTGNFSCNTFLPPGKVADFCGFQYMRDVDVNALGHNTSFVPRTANNILYILTDEQKEQLVSLAKEQEQVLTRFAYKRFPLIKAFCRQLEGDVPSGSTGLNREAVMKFTAELYEIDGLLSYRRAEVLGALIRSLTAKQKEYLASMTFNDSSTWPDLPAQLPRQSLSHTAHGAVMTYASEMCSWYAGHIEADVYFCPERHATYFGSFYMKDIPAMGNPDYSISTSRTGDSGEAFLSTLTESQRRLVAELVDQQREDLAEIVRTRRAIAAELRRFMSQSSADKAKVMALARRYGELDGEISFFYAKAFSELAKTLTAGQKQALLKLRDLDARYDCQGAFLYSQPIDLPEIPNTDFLFTSAVAAQPSSGTHVAESAAAFRLTSSAVTDGGQLPKEFTGDGVASTLPLQWGGVPEGTRGFAVIMHHLAPDGTTKWYWLLYNIPPDVRSLPKNSRNVGTLGNNSVNGRQEYAPPHSKGPGAKTYTYTIYALSAPLKPCVDPSRVDRDTLLAAMEGKVLASGTLHVTYTR